MGKFIVKRYRTKAKTKAAAKHVRRAGFTAFNGSGDGKTLIVGKRG